MTADIISAIRKQAKNDACTELILRSTDFAEDGSNSAPELSDFFERALLSPEITFRKTDGPLIVSSDGQMTLSGSAIGFGTAELPHAKLTISEVDGLSCIVFDGAWGEDYRFTLPFVSAMKMSEVGISVRSEAIDEEFPRELRLNTWEFRGDLDFGVPGKKFRVSLRSRTDGRWWLDCSAGPRRVIPLSGKGSAAELAGGTSVAKALPEALAGLISGVRRVSAEVDLSEAAVHSLLLDLAVVAEEKPWQITAGLAVEELNCSIALINPVPPAGSKTEDYPKSVEVGIAGQVAIGGVKIQVRVKGSSNPDVPWTVVVMPRDDDSTITLPGVSDVLKLAGENNLLSGWPNGFEKLPRIGLHRLEIAFNPWQPKTLERLYFHIETQKPWILVDGVCALTDLNIALDISDVTSEKTRRIAGRLQASLDIGKIHFFVGISLDQDLGSGWQIEGVADLTASGSLSGVLADLFPNAEKMPEALGAFLVTEVAASYQTGSGDMKIRVAGAIRTDSARVTLTLSAASPHSPAEGWQFEGSTGTDQKIPVGTLIRQFAGATANIPPALESLTFQNVGLSLNTANQEFSFKGTAELKLEEKQFGASLAVNFKSTGWNASGTLTVGGAEFQFEVKGNDVGQNLTAVWTDDNGRNKAPDLLTIAESLDLQHLGALLIPKKATLTVNFTEDEKSLALTCVQQTGIQAAFLLAQVPDKDRQPVWVAGFGVKPGRISTTSLGVIGTALQPYDISLDKLVVLAATGDGPEDKKLVLGDGEYSLNKGLFLKGTLEFANTSFSAPFECRIGGGEGIAVATPGIGDESTRGSTGSVTATNTGTAPKKSTPEEANNNVSIGKTIGPVTFRRARFESRDNRVYLKLDASLGTGGFALDMDGFSVNFPLTLLQDPIKNAGEISVGLDGLSIAYSKPPLTIAGGFAKTADAPKPYVGDLYRGFLVVEAAKFQVTVMGSYGNIEVNGKRESSLFLYGAYSGVVGGPAEFFVTGLALGGGYNTRLQIPPIEKVADFPLIEAVTDPGKFTVSSLGEAVQERIGPSPGDYWLAVGVKFTSYKIIDSFALFSVAFGSRLQFAVLGLTKLALPPEVGKDACAVYTELAIRAVLDPEAGVFCIEGQLTQNSFVLTKELHLTGGFAFFVWFGNARESGDFVISLGGYHKDFRRPAHYPLVPRIGLNGIIGPLTVKGEAYLALTPSCLMAGLKLEAVFAAGIITAAFVAYADFLMEWAPFRYDARIGVAIAVTINLLRTYRLEVSATLYIWGPPFAGTAVVTVFIFSFTIEFGDHSRKPAPRLTWEEFQKAFLPSATRGTTGSYVATVRFTEGLVREVEVGPQKENERVVYQIVNPHELVIETDSAIPCTEVRSGTSVRTAGTLLGIRPMGATKLASQHVVTIVDKDGKAVDSYFVPVRYSYKNFPEALWSPASASLGPGAKPTDPKMVEGALAGLALRVKSTQPSHKLGPFPIAAFAYSPIDKGIPWANAKPVPPPARGSFQAISEENARRIRERLPKQRSGWNQIAMQNTSADLNGRFVAPFLCTALGQSLAAAMTGNQ